MKKNPIRKETDTIVNGEFAIPENCIRCVHSSLEGIRSDALVRCTLKNPKQEYIPSRRMWLCKSFEREREDEFL